MIDNGAAFSFFLLAFIYIISKAADVFCIFKCIWILSDKMSHVPSGATTKKTGWNRCKYWMNSGIHPVAVFFFAFYFYIYSLWYEISEFPFAAALLDGKHIDFPISTTWQTSSIQHEAHQSCQNGCKLFTSTFATDFPMNTIHNSNMKHNNTRHI